MMCGSIGIGGADDSDESDDNLNGGGGMIGQDECGGGVMPSSMSQSKAVNNLDLISGVDRMRMRVYGGGKSGLMVRHETKL